MTNRRLIETIRGRAKAGDSMPIGSLAAQPRIHRFLLRSSLGVGAAGVVCAGVMSFGGGLATSAASAAAGAGGYGSRGARPAEVADRQVAGLAASAPVEVAAIAPIEPSALQGIVVPTTLPPTATVPTTAPAPATVAATPVSVARASIPAAQPAQSAPPAPGSVQEVIAEVFGPHASAAIGVARCESGLNPSAVSRGGGNWGLFQINKVHRDRVARMGFAWEQLLDARVNALVAKSIFDEQGWRPWACRHAAR